MEELERLEQKKKNRNRYIGSVVSAGIVSLAVMAYRGLFGGDLTTGETMMILSDGFFVTGALFLGLGLLMWVGGEGMFDMLGFGVKLVFDVAFKHEWENYRDYKARKAEKEKVPVGYLTWVGLGGILLAAVFTGLFYVYA